MPGNPPLGWEKSANSETARPKCCSAQASDLSYFAVDIINAKTSDIRLDGQPKRSKPANESERLQRRTHGYAQIGRPCEQIDHERQGVKMLEVNLGGTLVVLVLGAGVRWLEREGQNAVALV